MYIAYSGWSEFDNCDSTGSTHEEAYKSFCEKVRERVYCHIDTPPPVTGKQYYVAWIPGVTDKCESSCMGAGETKEQAMESLLKSLRPEVQIKKN